MTNLEKELSEKIGSVLNADEEFNLIPGLVQNSSECFDGFEVQIVNNRTARRMVVVLIREDLVNPIPLITRAVECIRES